MKIYNQLNVFKNVDYVILIPVIILIFWGVINIYSASINEYPNLYIKQIIVGIVGIFLMLFLSTIELRKLINISLILYGIGIMALLFVLIAGDMVLGAKRWINLGFFSLQPSEFMKVLVILTTAYYLSDKKSPISFIDGLVILLIASIPAFLTIIQPDLGTALTIIFPVIFIIFVYGIKKRYIFGALLVMIILSPYIWTHLKDYQKNRILAFINPEKDPLGTAYHIIQSKIAIGSGQITGKGFLNGTQSKLYFLPEQHTDFIFATIGEEWGFIATITILTIYMFLIGRILYWGIKIKDNTAKVVCFGAVAVLSFQAFINIAMTLGIAPVVGITLPFLSYGGSSLLSFSILIGTVLSAVSTFRKEKIQF
ncbi:MAG: rod shape-determining protein RodA [Aquificae bacterium]|nr:rod shape-determining protein RodA [Aquificota bacterium]